MSAKLGIDPGDKALSRWEGQTMADFKFDKKGLADLEKQVGQSLKKAEAEANEAASHEPTPELKARAFAKVLRKHGVGDVSEGELRRRFTR